MPNVPQGKLIWPAKQSGGGGVKGGERGGRGTRGGESDGRRREQREGAGARAHDVWYIKGKKGLFCRLEL